MSIKDISPKGDDEREIRQLRQRVAELERTDEDRAQMEAERYANALREERHSALLKLQHCESHDADEHEEEMVFHPHERPTLQRVRLSWGQRAAAAQAKVDAIDAELERVQVPSAR